MFILFYWKHFLLFHLLKSLFFYLFVFQRLSPFLPHHPWELHSVPPFFLRGWLPIYPFTTHLSYSPPASLTLTCQVSSGLGVSSLTEARQGSPLLHVCQRAIDQPMYGWWLSLYKLWVVHILYFDHVFSPSQLLSGPLHFPINTISLLLFLFKQIYNKTNKKHMRTILSQKTKQKTTKIKVNKQKKKPKQ